jgi:YidC/Oxa1 family membrane protein insertase
MDTQRLILLVVFAFSVMMLWQRWEALHAPPPPQSAAQSAAPAAGAGQPSAGAVPSGTSAPAQPGAASGGVPSAATPAVAAGPTAAAQKPVNVRTDVLDADIDPQGATLTRLVVLNQEDPVDPSKPFTLFTPEHHYALQSGFTGENLPNHRTLYHAAQDSYRLEDGKDTLQVRLDADLPNGVQSTKVLTFHRDSYLVDVSEELHNGTTAPINASAYFLLTRDNSAPGGETRFGVRTYTGPAYYTDETKYHKVSWSDLDKETPQFPAAAADQGWVAVIQHYFVSALIPPPGVERKFYADKASDQVYRVGFTVPLAAIAPGASAHIAVPLYAGPQEQAVLKSLAPGLELVVDYGWLKIIAVPLFQLLETLHSGVTLGSFHVPGTGNWGWSIVLLTVLIKAVFFPLSAASYKSMARMKQVAPRMNKLREQYGGDKARLNQAMMEMYKTEKINPLGGCLPIVVQIPVFLALYWTLLGAVELRQAPFMAWIKDLSLPDPYYVLPLLMLGSMVLQTRLSPTPPDPVQAKVMMIMPFVFGIMFFWFPSGLVLYWFVNNLLSIAQQWQITRMMGSAKSPA